MASSATHPGSDYLAHTSQVNHCRPFLQPAKESTPFDHIFNRTSSLKTNQLIIQYFKSKPVQDWIKESAALISFIGYSVFLGVCISFLTRFPGGIPMGAAAGGVTGSALALAKGGVDNYYEFHEWKKTYQNTEIYKAFTDYSQNEELHPYIDVVTQEVMLQPMRNVRTGTLYDKETVDRLFAEKEEVADPKRNGIIRKDEFVFDPQTLAKIKFTHAKLIQEDPVLQKAAPEVQNGMKLRLKGIEREVDTYYSQKVNEYQAALRDGRINFDEMTNMLSAITQDIKGRSKPMSTSVAAVSKNSITVPQR